MTSLSFKATVDSFSRTKKGDITIQLTGTSYISLDKLSQIAEGDESIMITLDSMQTQLDVGDPITLKGEDLAERLKDAAARLEKGDEDE